MPSLFFHAGDPHWTPEDPAHLTAVLRQLGFLGAPLEAAGGGAYRAGDEFLGLVMFLGCSPQVELDPDAAPAGAAVCYISIYQYPDVQFIAADRRPQPRCPQCRAPVEPLPDLASDTLYHCEECNTASPLHAIDWRHAAGFGRCFIEVHGIYPQEAVPVDKLLQQLETCSGSKWDYFYV